MIRMIKAVLLFFLLGNAGQATALPFWGLISLDEATQQLLKTGSMRILAAKTEVKEGRNVHIIKVLTDDGRIQYEKIDEQTGRILKPK